MSKKYDDGGPAFPRPLAETTGSFDNGDSGMTLRDYFAGQALAPVLRDDQIRKGLELDFDSCRRHACRAQTEAGDMSKQSTTGARSMKKSLDEFSAEQVKEARSALDKCDRLMPALMQELIRLMDAHDLSPDYALLVVSRLTVPVLATEMLATGERAVPMYHAMCTQVVVHAASDALLETEH